MKDRKKAIIISIVAIAVLAAGVFAVFTIGKDKKSDAGTKTYDNMEEAVSQAAFNMEYPDRLCGYPATEFASNSSTIEIKYAAGGYIRKTLGVNNNSGENENYPETEEQVINGRSVTCSGEDGLLTLATWKDNNFAYTVKLNTGVTLDEITEYIESTR